MPPRARKAAATKLSAVKDDDDELVITDPPAPQAEETPALALSWTSPTGSTVVVALEQPDAAWFRGVRPGDVLKLRVLAVQEQNVRVRKPVTPPANAAPKRKR